MRYYIAYKYSNHNNKEELIQKLEHLSQRISSWGYETFILGRDVKKWRHIHFGSFKLVPVIYKNMKRCDRLVAYVDSSSFSKGLLFEIIISKLLGKHSVLIDEVNYGTRLLKPFFNSYYSVSGIDGVEKMMLDQDN